MLNFIGFVLGIFLPKILNYNNILIGEKGIEYYAEVHTTTLNSYCHSIGMPFTIYGMLLCIPMLFKLKYKKYIEIQNMLYIMYMTHYITINFKIGLIISLLYSLPLYFSHKKIKEYFYNIEIYKVNEYNYARFVLFIQGLMISTAALVFQEIFGHWLSGDPPSRLEAVPNAIIYAMYYSVSHILS